MKVHHLLLLNLLLLLGSTINGRMHNNIRGDRHLKESKGGKSSDLGDGDTSIYPGESQSDLAIESQRRKKKGKASNEQPPQNEGTQQTGVTTSSPGKVKPQPAQDASPCKYAK
jgi:hypothetical protein